MWLNLIKKVTLIFSGSKAVHLWLLRLPDHFYDHDSHHDPEWSSCCHLHLTLSGLWRLCLGWILNQSSRHCTTGEKVDFILVFVGKNDYLDVILVIVGKNDYLLVSYELFPALFSFILH